MPMIDALIPQDALTPKAEQQLIEDLTQILIRAEGYDPLDPVPRSVTVLNLHRPAAVYCAGELSTVPRYRVIPSVPEGQYSKPSRARLVVEITEAFARAENTIFNDIAPRVWVFPTEIPEGQWGARGLIRSVADIHAYLVGDPQRRGEAEARLARRREEKAHELLSAAANAANGSE